MALTEHERRTLKPNYEVDFVGTLRMTALLRNKAIFKQNSNVLFEDGLLSVSFLLPQQNIC